MFGFGIINHKKNTRLSAAVKTDMGRIRLNNEDNFYLCGRYKSDVGKASDKVIQKECLIPALFAVCDGMGGEEYGELASLIAVQNLRPVQYKTYREAVKDNIHEITVLIDNKRRELKAANMGCTLAALYIDSGYAVSCNLGDSRVYLFRKEKLKQLSLDHREGRNVLLQYLGVSPDEFILDPFFTRLRLKNGDRFLLCSDGVTDMLNDADIAECLKQKKTPEDIVEDIVNAALQAGGSDNVTALAVDVSI